MKKDKLLPIRRKVNDIGFGLLRLRNGDCQLSLQVNTKFEDDCSVRCFTDHKADLTGLKDSMISLVQKRDNDYLYIAGQVEEIEKAKGGRIVSIRVFKASWFARKAKGSLSWLQEKHVYDISEGRELQMVS